MVFPFLVIRLKSGMYIQIPQKKQIINADWLRWVGDDMLSFLSSSLYLLGALTVCKHTLVLHRDIAALAAIYGYLVALDLAYRKNIYCYNGNNSIIDNDRTIASSRRSS